MLDPVRDWIHRSRWTAERALGARGEDLAMRYLQKQRYVIVGRNYQPKNQKGEVDLIGWENEALAFVEVKTRSSDETEAPERAVHIEKQRHIIRAAEAYTRKAKVDWDVVRFDVVTVVISKKPLIALYRNAFQPSSAGA